MSFDYAGLRTKVVIPNLRKFGTQVSFTQYTDTHDVTTGAVTRDAETRTAYAVVGSFKVEAVDGQMVQAGDKRVLIAGIPEPKAGDRITVGDRSYTVVGVNATAPDGGDAVLYELHVRV